MAIITISRQMSSLGDEIAETVARRLGWELITRKTLLQLFFSSIVPANDLYMLNESSRYFHNLYKDQETYKEHLERAMRAYAGDHSAVLIGFGSQIIFAGDKDAIHVRVVAPQSIRVTRVKKQYHVSDGEAAQILTTADRKHKKFVAIVFGADLAETAHYHLTLNTENLSVDECASTIVALQKDHEQRRSMERQSGNTEVINHLSDRPAFKNPAEIEFAQILDMYQIEWVYEPKTFPVEWDAEGNVTLAFSPDFYLIQFDTYIELTTMNQRYVTEKNKKVKRLRELYPGINIRIVYKKDFQSLIERFNRT